MTSRSAALLTGLSLTLGSLAVAPAATGAAVQERSSAAATPKVGTYEGTWGDGYFIAFDVTRSKGRLVVKNAVSMYACGGETVYSTFGTARVRNGRFSRDGIVSIRGAFTSRKKASGRANPAPDLQGCTGKAEPYRVVHAGKAVSRTGDYTGTDATGAPITLSVEGAGKIVGGIDVSRRLQCGSVGYTNLFRFGRAGIPVASAAQSSFTDDHAILHTYSATFTDRRTVTGTYQVAGPGCDTGVVAFTATRG